MPLAPEDIRQVLREMPGIHAYRDTAQVFTTGVTDVVDLDKERYKRDGLVHSTSVNPHRITVTFPGIVLIVGYTNWANNVAGRRQTVLQVNSAVIAIDNRDCAVAANGRCTVSALWPVVPGDNIDMTALQTSGGNLNLDAAFLAVHRIGD